MASLWQRERLGNSVAAKYCPCADGCQSVNKGGRGRIIHSGAPDGLSWNGDERSANRRSVPREPSSTVPQEIKHEGAWGGIALAAAYMG